MDKKNINVLIVDDSAVSSDLLQYIIESSPELKVIGKVKNGLEALEFLKHHSPDVITMDIVMPQMDGFAATSKIMHDRPIPIIIISGTYQKENIEKSFRAMEAGALAILEKPKGPGDANFSMMSEAIVTSIKTVAGVKLITRRGGKAPSPVQTPEKLSEPSPKASLKSLKKGTVKAVALGTSLGGPQTLEKILAALPSDFPAPILIVQHIASGFTQGLVDWLNLTSSIKVNLATHGKQALPGNAYVAPDNFHLEITSENIMHLSNAPPVHGIRPSVAALFSSMEKAHGPHCIGVILTGMGGDGAEELLAMKQSGAITIAQNEESSILFGMPKEAIRLDAATLVLPLDQIAPTLTELSMKSVI